jgi:hypothetical protein
MNYIKNNSMDEFNTHLKKQIENIKTKIMNAKPTDNNIIHIFINASKQSSGYINYRNNINDIIKKGSSVIIYFLTDKDIVKKYGPIPNTNEYHDELFLVICDDVKYNTTQYIDIIYKYIGDNMINNYLVYY